MDRKYIDNILPDLNDELFAPFWEGTRQSELKFPYCTSCKRFHWYPRYRCPFCGSGTIEWVNSKGKGTIFTWTVVHRPFLEAYENWVPYTVALIEFDDIPGVRFVSNIVDAGTECVSIGQTVSAVYYQINDKTFLPMFKPEVGK